MLTQLSVNQARVIGVLLEKEITTPEQYPLTVNALVLGCNQKSNREPVMSMDEEEVQSTLDELVNMRLVSQPLLSGSRVSKYIHRFCNTEFGDLKLSQQQLAIVCVLLLRGPQTPGELRSRTNRLAEFSSVLDVEHCLHSLTELNGEELVRKLAKEPGKRDARFAHLFSGEPSQIHQPASLESHPPTDDHSNRIAQLEEDVAKLKQQIALLIEKTA